MTYRTLDNGKYYNETVRITNLSGYIISVSQNNGLKAIRGMIVLRTVIQQINKENVSNEPTVHFNRKYSTTTISQK